MNTSRLKARLVLAGKVATVLCPVLVLLLLSHFSLAANAKPAMDNNVYRALATPVPVAFSSYAAVDPQARYRINADAPNSTAVPTVPTVSETATATPTSSVTPTPSPTSSVVNPSNNQLFLPVIRH